MSIRYRLFNRPTNLDEFIDKAQRKNKEVKVRIAIFSPPVLFSFSDTNRKIIGQVAVSINGNRSTIVIAEYQYYSKTAPLFSARDLIARIKIKEKCIRKSIKVAETLNDIGLSISVAGVTIGQSKEILNQTRRQIKEKCEEHGSREKSILITEVIFNS